jgi:hypothetical protein
MERGSTAAWWRWPFRLALLPFGVFWPIQIAYLGMKFVNGGPRAAMGWLHHISTRMTADGLFVTPTARHAFVTEGAMLVLTVVLWWASGFPVWPQRPKS